VSTGSETVFWISGAAAETSRTVVVVGTTNASVLRSDSGSPVAARAMNAAKSTATTAAEPPVRSMMPLTLSPCLLIGTVAIEPRLSGLAP